MTRLPFPEEWLEPLVDALAERVRARIEETTGAGDEWVRGAKAAATVLDCTESRIFALTSSGRLPHEKDGSALMFRRSKLDLFVVNGGAIRP